MFSKVQKNIEIMNAEGFAGMRKAGRNAASLLNHLSTMVKPGICTQDLDDAAVAWVKERGLINAPLGYGGPDNAFPRSICTSVNEVVCHGIPNKHEILKKGDIINIDVTPITDGYHGDTSRTIFVGEPSDEIRKLVETTELCLRKGIEVVKPGARLGDIGKAIEACAHARGYGVVKDFVGHGIGRRFHTPPQIAHYDNGDRTRIKAGMVFTIEPMINLGTWESEILDDGWTAITLDGKASAQFEHTMGVTEKGVEIFTLEEGVDYFA